MLKIGEEQKKAMRDSTRRKKERQFLSLIKKAADQSSQAILLTSANLEYPHPKILYANEAFTKMSGYQLQELIGKTPRLFQGTKTDDRVLKQLKKALSEGKVFSGSLINYRKDGTEYFVEMDIAPVKDESGHITHYMSSLKDITSKLESEAEKEEFLGIISHELKNPLTTIRGFIHLLKGNLQKHQGKKFLEYLSTMEVEANRINGLLNDLLDFAKMRSKKMVSNYELCDVDDLLLQVIRKFRRTISTHKIYRRGRIKEKLKIDPSRINQVVVNLLNNAVKYSPNAHAIFVHAKLKGSKAIISIQDFGVGIPPDKQKEIFERYYRINEKVRNKIEGSGLGLYIASEIVKDHKGEIGVTSKEGAGSTFFFSLPLAR